MLPQWRRRPQMTVVSAACEVAAAVAVLISHVAAVSAARRAGEGVGPPDPPRAMLSLRRYHRDQLICLKQSEGLSTWAKGTNIMSLSSNRQ